MGYPETVFTLREPLVLNVSNFEPINTITLREPKAFEMDEVSQQAKSPSGELILTVALIGKIPKAAAGQLCKRDLEDISRFFASFSGVAQPTGETESQT